MSKEPGAVQHVVQEMFLRGEPPVPQNFHPTVAKAILFPDKNLCEQAADAVGKVRISEPVLVKHGKADRMRALYERGDVYMPPATVYDDPEHNQAIHDQELSFSHCGVVTNQFGPLKAHDVSPIRTCCEHPIIVSCLCSMRRMPQRMKSFVLRLLDLMPGCIACRLYWRHDYFLTLVPTRASYLTETNLKPEVSMHYGP